MPSPTVEIVTYKALGAFSVTAFSSVPFLMGVIEPATYADIEARYLYMGISSASAFVVVQFYRPKDKRELFGRLLAAAVMAFAFTEPLAIRLRPYVSQSALPDAAPIAAALPAAVFLGICGWWVVGLIAWFSKSPTRIFRLIDWWRGRTTIQSVFAEDSDASVTSTNGGSQGQSAIGVTRTPTQEPSKTVPSVAASETSTKTTV